MKCDITIITVIHNHIPSYSRDFWKELRSTPYSHFRLDLRWSPNFYGCAPPLPPDLADTPPTLSLVVLAENYTIFNMIIANNHRMSLH